MTAKGKSTKNPWIDPDDAPELTAEVAARARVSHGTKVLRETTGTYTRRGRPPLGAARKEQVTLRLSREVIDHFKAGGPGWQSRIDEALKKVAEHAG